MNALPTSNFPNRRVFNAFMTVANPCLAVLGLGVLGMGCSSFSSSTPKGPDPTVIGTAWVNGVSLPSAEKVQHLFSKRPGGTITDLDLSQDGEWIWFAARPDVDLVAPISKPRLTLMNKSGAVFASVEPGAQVREISISRDGQLMVVATHDDQVIGYVRGKSRLKEVFRAEGTCRPRVAGVKQPIIVCYHDDDADSAIAFHLLDGRGKRIAEYTMQAPGKPQVMVDVLALKVSADGRYVVIGETGGGIRVFRLDSLREGITALQPSASFSVMGEIIDLAIAPPSDAHRTGRSPEIAALYRRPSQSNAAVSVIDQGGHATEAVLDQSYDHLVWSTPKILGLYGNRSGGQRVAGLSHDAGRLVVRWTQAETHVADYSSALLAFPEGLIVNFDRRVSPGNRRIAEVLGWSAATGARLWSTPVIADEGAFTTWMDYSSVARFLVLSTDDGQVHGYRVTP